MNQFVVKRPCLDSTTQASNTVDSISIQKQTITDLSSSSANKYNVCAPKVTKETDEQKNKYTGRTFKIHGKRIILGFLMIKIKRWYCARCVRKLMKENY